MSINTDTDLRKKADKMERATEHTTPGIRLDLFASVMQSLLDISTGKTSEEVLGGEHVSLDWEDVSLFLDGKGIEVDESKIAGGSDYARVLEFLSGSKKLNKETFAKLMATGVVTVVDGELQINLKQASQRQISNLVENIYGLADGTTSSASANAMSATDREGLATRLKSSLFGDLDKLANKVGDKDGVLTKEELMIAIASGEFKVRENSVGEGVILTAEEILGTDKDLDWEDLPEILEKNGITIDPDMKLGKHLGVIMKFLSPNMPLNAKNLGNRLKWGVIEIKDGVLSLDLSKASNGQLLSLIKNVDRISEGKTDSDAINSMSDTERQQLETLLTELLGLDLIDKELATKLDNLYGNADGTLTAREIVTGIKTGMLDVTKDGIVPATPDEED